MSRTRRGESVTFSEPTGFKLRFGDTTSRLGLDGDPLPVDTVATFELQKRNLQLQIDVESHPVFEGLDELQQWGARTAKNVLGISQTFGYIDLATRRRIVDFGAGSGGPTLSLVQLAEQNGGSVDAVESRSPQVQDMIDSGIIPAEHAHVGDGIDFLKSSGEAGGKFDLITAFMLGPDCSGQLTREVLSVAQGALDSGGQLLVTSEIDTMSTVRSVCDQLCVPYDYIHGVPMKGETGSLPNTLIASFPPGSPNNNPEVIT